MTKPTIRIHDLASDEVIDREMTDAEFDIYEAEQAKDNAKAEAQQQAANDKAALLAKLGITEAEAALLLS
jgi:hypothetical protein